MRVHSCVFVAVTNRLLAQDASPIGALACGVLRPLSAYAGVQFALALRMLAVVPLVLSFLPRIGRDLIRGRLDGPGRRRDGLG